MIKITNTISGKKEELIPRHNKTIQMFVCGPTVYDYIHIGNARTFVFFDVVAKYLRYRGYDVDYIQNITDIEDKIMQRAKEAGRDPLDWAKEYENKFLEDMKNLGVTAVSRYARATDHIEQVIKQVKTLKEKGHAYLIENDGWYFDLKTFPDYGKLSKRTVQMADDAVSRIDESEKKRNAGDFALWKLSNIGDPAWSFKTGEYLGANDGSPAFAKASAGKPGWHIEDTAITEHYFGPQYDLHGGGQDLIFPHHEVEITQQESASGKTPFVKYWMHVAFVINKERKMSKSLGNFTTAHELLEKYPKEVLRFYLLSGYYRSPLDFGDKILHQSEAGIQRISEFVQKLSLTTGDGKDPTGTKTTEEARQKFLEAMDDDFNTPRALAAVFDLIRNLNPLVSRGALDKDGVNNVRSFLKEVDSILGVVPSKHEKIPEEVLELVGKREKLREEKNWQEADKIRAQIEKLDYKVEDTVFGPLVSFLK
ncbi:MAG: cysteine--tRNA ligase [Patescibacteria group bacterium]